MKSWKFTKYVLIAVALLLVILFWSHHKSSKSDMGARNETTVKRKDLVQRVTVNGQVWPKKRFDVKPTFNGYVEKIYVKVGDKVTAGQPLVTFSPSLGRGETNFPVRAAFNGVVTQSLKGEGEYVTESGDQNLVLRVEDLSQLFVMASVPELDVAKIKVGQEASVKVSALVGESFTGSISEISLSATAKDRWSSASTEFQIKVLLTTQDPRLFPGMSVLMDVVTNKSENVLILSHEYIQQQDNDFFVTTTTGEKKKVIVGLQTDEAVEIKSGLQEDEHIQVVDFLSLPALEK